MKNKHILFVFTFLLSFLRLDIQAHPHYVGMYEIFLEPLKNNMNLNAKFFIDDFQKAIYEEKGIAIDIMNSSSLDEDVISNYVLEHIDLWLDDNKLNLRYGGFEIDEESIWIYFESSVKTEQKKVRFSNSALYKSFKQQTFFVECHRKKESKTFKLSNPMKEVSFNFE